MRISRKWRKKAEVYKQFAEGGMDFSEEKAEEMFLYESRGIGSLKRNIFSPLNNGYFYGKRMLDLQVKEWREGIREGIVFKQELLNDEKYPQEWIKSVLEGVVIEDKERLKYIKTRYFKVRNKNGLGRRLSEKV